MPKLTHGERLASVETDLKALRADVGEMKADIKTLLAAHYRQRGVAKLLVLLWAGLLTLGGIVGCLFAGRGHG